MTITSPHPYDRHISPILLTVTSPPLKGAGGMFIIVKSTHRQIDKLANLLIC